MADEPKIEYPFPAIQDYTEGYWQGAIGGKIRAQQCKACGYVRLPPTAHCSQCLSTRSKWVDLSGHGSIWSWVIMHRPYFKHHWQVPPYLVALVRLDEGPLISAAIDADQERLAVGKKLRARLEEVAPGRFLPVFELT